MTPDRPKPRPSVVNKDGSINQSLLSSRYGIGVKEAMTMVQYTTHDGTHYRAPLVQVLEDPRCPFGPGIESAYQTRGIDGVLKAFEGAKAFLPPGDFDVTVSQETIQRSKQLEAQKAQARDVPTRETPQPEETVQSAPSESLVRAAQTSVVVDAPVREEQSIHAPVVTHQEQDTTLPVKVAPVLALKAIETKSVQSTISPAEPALPKGMDKIHPSPEVSAIQHDSAQPITRRSPSLEKVNFAEAIKERVKVVKEKVATTIDKFLSFEKDKPKSEERVVDVTQEKGKITIGAQSKGENGKEKNSPRLKPIATTDELVSVLDVLSQLTTEKPSTQKIGSQTKEGQSPTREINLLVTQDVLQFISGSKGMMRELLAISGKQLDAEQLVKVVSDEQEIFIELATLKELLQLIKARKHMQSNDTPTPWILPEEMGLHTDAYHNHDIPGDTVSLWPFYQGLMYSPTTGSSIDECPVLNPSQPSSHILFPSA